MSSKLEKLEQKKAELKRKQDELKNEIQLLKRRKQAEKRKKATHYKVLIGAYALHSFVERGELPQSTAEQLKKFINDDKKFAELKAFIESEINES